MGADAGGGALVAGAVGEWQPFEYVVLRLVPRVDRGEFINAAVLLYVPALGYLGMRIRADLATAAGALPDVDVAAVLALLADIEATVAGRGPAGAAAPGVRFRWLAAPRSSVLQPGPIHTGISRDPGKELDRLRQSQL